MATAACETEVMWRPMAVSVRARLPASSAWRNRRLRVGPAAPSSRARSQACFTWPRISLSPSTAESSPAATAKRWATAGAS